MKQIYKATDGEIFERKKECLEHEFKLKGGSENFKSMVKESVLEVEKVTGLKIDIKEAKAKVDWDGDPNTDEMNYVEWQEIELTVYVNGGQRGEIYSRGSQGSFTKEYLVDALIKEYHTPYQKIHEGIVSDSDDGWLVSEGYAIDGINVNEILRANYGRKVRIEILD